MVANVLAKYFLFEDGVLPGYDVSGVLSSREGYFRFGDEAICFGKFAGIVREDHTAQIPDVREAVRVDGETMCLPFDPDAVINNLTHERYTTSGFDLLIARLLRSAYYIARPILPVDVRKHFQKLYLRNWRRLSFPKWPVDPSVDVLMNNLLATSMQVSGRSKVPFIWFWPRGFSACAIMTHDVETSHGLEFCSTLIDIDSEFDIPASFQLVPESRYRIAPELIRRMESMGFEVGVQDLNHDGRLFWRFEEFKRRAKRINAYGRQFRAVGFRSAILYRNQEWFKLLDFEYDMSVPNVAHLDPQHGGCCTVKPYFIDNVLELPVTTTQDYSLFHILNDYSLNLWRQQMEIILRHNGLISFIVHPDYIVEARAQAVYRELLAELNRLRAEKNVWIALPREVNGWWRNRSKMKLSYRDGDMIIEGPESETACIAYASLEGEDLVFSVPEQSGSHRTVRA